VHTVALVFRPSAVVDLQVQNIAGDDSKEDAFVIKPYSTEHGPGRDVTELFELIEDKLPERIRHAERIRF
jgi:hypothetical protein